MQLKTKDTVINTFHSAINWNALLHITMNISYTAISTIFFYRLTNAHYNIWANINSFIYIILLWCDCGFRKAIPLYLPRIESDKQSLSRFIRFIIISQLIICSIGMISLGFILFRLTHSPSFVIYGLLVFLLEAPLVLLQSLYHGKFLNREYNGRIISLLMIELFFMSSLFLFLPSTILLHAYFILRITFLATSNLVTGSKIAKEYSTNSQPRSTKEEGGENKLVLFARHSLTMWSTTTLRSLSERNILVPLLTFMVGAQAANVYKLGNDWALFIQRAIIKSIGTTDISLIAHINHYCNFHDINNIFQKIMRKVLMLVIPSAFIVFLSFLYQFNSGFSFTFILFLVLVCSYLFEILCAPYQRILEAQRHYKFLFAVHCLYLIIPLLCFLTPLHNLVNILFIVIGIRALTVLCCLVYARLLYGLTIPWPSVDFAKLKSVT
ncbi:MAG TPA: hypothetical protein QGF02_01795 [Candidatus Babeliales bacterium]|nr:hypothetical protein [Candidatus Babeliales bacterium]